MVVLGFLLAETWIIAPRDSMNGICASIAPGTSHIAGDGEPDNGIN